MNSEELKIIEDERQKILNDILEELQTKSLKELFLETSDKEKRMKKAKDAMEKLYKDLHFNESMIKYNECMIKYGKRKKESTVSFEKDFLLKTQKKIDEFKNDYSNYIQGGYGFISKYLGENESESEDESELEDVSELEDESESEDESE